MYKKIKPLFYLFWYSSGVQTRHLFAVEAASGMAWFLYFIFLNCDNWNTYSFPFTSHFDSNFNQDQLHLHLTPAFSWATVRASSSSNSLIPNSLSQVGEW